MRRGAPVLQLLAHAFAWFALLLSGPAFAQVAGSIGIDSDYRLRGNSLSDNQPTASAQLTYDDPSGVYFSLSGLTEFGHSGRFLGAIGNFGYAKRLNEHLTFDGGMVRYQIRSAFSGLEAYKYTEVYAGVYVGPVMGRLSYSPDYRSEHVPTLYGELEGGLNPGLNWRLTGHLGLLTYLKSSYVHRAGETYRDWRVSVTRQFGNFEVHSALSNRAPNTDEAYQARGKVVFTLGGSVSF